MKKYLEDNPKTTCTSSHLQSFKKIGIKTIRGVASTSYPSHYVYGLAESWTDGWTDQPILTVPIDVGGQMKGSVK